MLEYIKIYDNTSAIDVWGLGCIVIELIHGLPLWLNNPTKILIKGRYETKKGLFAVSDRSFSKILESQLSIVNNFEDFLRNQVPYFTKSEQQLNLFGSAGKRCLKSNAKPESKIQNKATLNCGKAFSMKSKKCPHFSFL